MSSKVDLRKPSLKFPVPKKRSTTRSSNSHKFLVRVWSQSREISEHGESDGYSVSHSKESISTNNTTGFLCGGLFPSSEINLTRDATDPVRQCACHQLVSPRRHICSMEAVHDQR